MKLESRNLIERVEKEWRNPANYPSHNTCYLLHMAGCQSSPRARQQVYLVSRMVNVEWQIVKSETGHLASELIDLRSRKQICAGAILLEIAFHHLIR